MTTPTHGTLPGAEHTVLRGYGPFVALVALMLAMALLAPTVAPERDVTTRPAPPTDNLRSSGTGGVPQERRSGAAGAAVGILRSSAMDGCCG
jgi:hypothetical protein